jgi:hypothetical protein
MGRYCNKWLAGRKGIIYMSFGFKALRSIFVVLARLLFLSCEVCVNN